MWPAQSHMFLSSAGCSVRRFFTLIHIMTSDASSDGVSVQTESGTLPIPNLKKTTCSRTLAKVLSETSSLLQASQEMQQGELALSKGPG